MISYCQLSVSYYELGRQRNLVLICILKGNANRYTSIDEWTCDKHYALRVSAGNDKLFGGGSNDTINGNDGNDDVTGGSGNDTINGNDGNDDLKGESGYDIIVGGNGNDTIDGGYAADFIRGGDGDDVIYDDKKDDIDGGSSNNTLVQGVDKYTM